VYYEAALAGGHPRLLIQEVPAWLKTIADPFDAQQGSEVVTLARQTYTAMLGAGIPLTQIEAFHAEVQRLLRMGGR
jgi:hypothetical protein